MLILNYIKKNVFSVILFFSLFFAAIVSAQDEPFYRWDDREAAEATIDNLQVNLQSSPYFDSWEHWMWLDNGDFLFVQFVVSSFGFGIERQGSVKAIYVRDGFQTTAHGRNTEGVFRARRGFEWDDGDWSFEESGFEMHFQDCEMSFNNGVFSLIMHDDTLSVDVSFQPELDLYRPGDGRLSYGWDRHTYYDLTVLPRFNFSGQMSARVSRSDPENWVEIAGVGYAEHNRMNNFPFELGRRWNGVRALREDGLTIIYDEVLAPTGYEPERAPWMIIALGDEIIFEAQEIQIQALSSMQDTAVGHTYTLPQNYSLLAVNGEDWVQLQIQTRELVSRENPLAILSPIIQAILAQQMIPSDYEFRVDYEAQIHIDGHTAHVAGAGWETLNYTR